MENMEIWRVRRPNDMDGKNANASDFYQSPSNRCVTSRIVTHTRIEVRRRLSMSTCVLYQARFKVCLQGIIASKLATFNTLHAYMYADMDRPISTTSGQGGDRSVLVYVLPYRNRQAKVYTTYYKSILRCRPSHRRACGKLDTRPR